jgi:uncharacterized membrane protein YdjX (TVP38/TMEM64 family)
MNFLIGFLLGAAPGLIIYVVGARGFKDWLWILPAKVKEQVVSKVRKLADLIFGKE